MLAVLGTGLLLLGGQYAVLTYITPFLQERTGDLAATLPASALNVGIALGALAGGWTLDDYGAGGPLITGLVVTAVALPAAWATAALRPTSTHNTEGVSA